MNIIGTWKVTHVRGVDEAGNAVMLNQEEYAETLTKSGYPAERMKERMVMFGQKYHFTEDNLVEIMMPIPEGIPQDKIDELVASGSKIVDGMMVIGSPDPEDAVKWKEEDGKFFVTGEFDFETNEINWVTIDVIDENTLGYMMLRIVRE